MDKFITNKNQPLKRNPQKSGFIKSKQRLMERMNSIKLSAAYNAKIKRIFKNMFT